MQNFDSIKNMSVQDRLQLIEAIWQTLDENMLQEDERELSLLTGRLEEYKRNPEQTENWQDFKNRMLKKQNGSK
jgi:putative addiction module component (TIGR02574 family)